MFDVIELIKVLGIWIIFAFANLQILMFLLLPKDQHKV